MREAMARGSVLASYVIESFSVNALASVTQADIEKREKKLKKDNTTLETMKRLAAKEREQMTESLTDLEKARTQAAERNAEVAEVLKELDSQLPRLPPKFIPGD